MTIKMSEVFELPVQVSAIIDNSRFKPTSKKDVAATLAINAYDANQQEISALKMENAQLKGENASMAAYADQRIRMLTRVNNKLREGKS